VAQKAYQKKWALENAEHIKAREKAYRLANKEALREKQKAWGRANREREAARMRAYRERQREHVRARNRELYAEQREQRRAYQAEWYRKNLEKEKARSAGRRSRPGERERANAYLREYLKTHPDARLARRLRCRIRDAFRRLHLGEKPGSSVRDLGCSIEFLKSYLESKFQPDMTWENWGLHGWHIDHIRPLSSFDLTDRAQFIQACHYTNLQPLWAEDNLSKGSKTSWEPLGATQGSNPGQDPTNPLCASPRAS
jgi:hypothetical protein